MKQLAVFFLLMLPNIYPVTAQFSVTADGIVNAENAELKYVTCSFEGISKDELFKKALLFLTHTKSILQSNAEAGVIEFNGDSIHFASPRLTTVTRTGRLKTDLSLYYTISVFFKDGKIRFNAPGFKLKGTVVTPGMNYGRLIDMYLRGERSLVDADYYIFDEQGRLQESEIRQHLEEYFNRLYASMVKALAERIEDEDW